MARPFLNLHMANLPPSDIPDLEFTKFYILSLLPWTQLGSLLGVSIPRLLHCGWLCPFSGTASPHIPRHAGSPSSSLLPQFLARESSKSRLCLPCPAIGCQQLYLPIKTNWGQGPSEFYMHTEDSCAIGGGGINIIKVALDQIYNRVLSYPFP